MLIENVLPLRTAPSQMIALFVLLGLSLHHQVMTASCFSENDAAQRESAS